MSNVEASWLMISMVVALLNFPLYYSGYSNILEALTMGSIDVTRDMMSMAVALFIFPYIRVVTVHFSRPLL